MPKQLLSAYLIAIFTIGLTNCHPKAKTQANNKPTHRGIASIKTNKFNLSNYPTSLVSFILGKEQRLNLSPTLKQYSKILPQKIYDKIINLSEKVDDSGFSIKRSNNQIILNNGKEFTLNAVGTPDNLQIIWNEKKYDLTDENTFMMLLNQIDKNINNSNKTSHLNPNLLPIITFTNQAQAANTGWWFAIGGLALVSLAIMYSANKLGKSIKKTEHTVYHKFDVGDQTTDSINNLADSISEIDTTGTVNINVDSPSTGSAIFKTEGVK